MGKNLKNFKIIVVASIIILFAMVIYLVFFKYDSAENISNGNIRYSETYGWINLEHAMPEGSMELLKNINKKADTTNNKFTVKYSQKMKYALCGIFLVAEVSSEYSLPLSINHAQEKDAALSIFMEVSEKFEQMQGNFPFSLVPEAQNSSFRSGDLTGNLLSYYLAINSLNLKDELDTLNLVPIQSAVLLWKEESTRRDKDWKVSDNANFLDGLLDTRKRVTVYPELIKTGNSFYIEAQP